jgi:hypothetical protein
MAVDGLGIDGFCAAAGNHRQHCANHK